MIDLTSDDDSELEESEDELAIGGGWMHVLSANLLDSFAEKEVPSISTVMKVELASNDRNGKFLAVLRRNFY